MKQVGGMLFSFFMFWALSVMATAADQAESSPDAVVGHVTDELLALAKTGSTRLKEDPKGYYADVRALLEPAVDFETIAKNVMGKRYWLAATEAQRAQFVDVFTDSLVETYGKGMANFANFEVNIESSQASESSEDTHYVVQSVKTNSGVTKVVYTMRHSSEGWRLYNVVLDGVNLGKTFRSQFDQAVRDNDNDIGQAIANWGKQQA